MRLAALGFPVATLCTAGRASAQGTGTLAGRVFESDGVPSAAGAIVRIDGTDMRAFDYRILDVPAGTCRVSTVYVGAKTETVEVDISAEKTRVVHFVLNTSGWRSGGWTKGEDLKPMVSTDVPSSRIWIADEIEQLPINR